MPNRSQLANYLLIVTLLLMARSPAVAVDRLRHGTPEQAGLDGQKLAEINDVVAQGIAAGEMPGCVVCIGSGNRIVLLKAFGHRQIEPEQVPMTTDTVFDLASLTKPIATATSVMILVERGELALEDRVAKYLPDFAANGKEAITIQDCLLHQSGLTPDNALSDYEDGPAKAFERIHALSLRAPVRTKFMYSDVGFIVLGEVIRAKTGKDVHQFSRANIFRPLEMKETSYLPAQELQQRAAPTEKRDGHWMQGEVHDPRAHLLGGVAGHAGLFSTAEDLAVYAQMMIDGGEYRRVRILKEETVALFTQDQKLGDNIRALGWDKRSSYSSNRGRGMSDRAFGHGGFTGTSLWIDPGRDLFVIFLSNRLHPDGKGSVNSIAGRIGTIAVESQRE